MQQAILRPRTLAEPHGDGVFNKMWHQTCSARARLSLQRGAEGRGALRVKPEGGKEMVAITLFLLSAHAWELDLTAASSTCDSQWSSATCLSNDVWGDDDALSLESCTVPVLYARGTSTQAAAIGFEKQNMDGGGTIYAYANGYAASSSAKVKLQVRYFNASNVNILTEMHGLHTGASGRFAGRTSFAGPGAAVKYSTRLVIEDGMVVLLGAEADDDDDEGTVEGTCEVTCQGPNGPYELAGFQEGGLCSAVCPEDEESYDPFGECDPETWPME